MLPSLVLVCWRDIMISQDAKRNKDATHHMTVRAVGVQMVLAPAAVASLRLRSQGALGGDVVGEFAAVVAAHAASPAIAIGFLRGGREGG